MQRHVVNVRNNSAAAFGHNSISGAFQNHGGNENKNVDMFARAGWGGRMGGGGSCRQQFAGRQESEGGVQTWEEVGRGGGRRVAGGLQTAEWLAGCVDTVEGGVLTCKAIAALI